jgi:hypothetical protein
MSWDPSREYYNRYAEKIEKPGKREVPGSTEL